MRIGILTYGLHKGGRGRIIAQLANGLAQHGHEPYLLMLQGQPVAYSVDVPIERVDSFQPRQFPAADVLVPASLGLIPFALARTDRVTVPFLFRFEPDVAYDRRTAVHLVSLPYRSMATAADVAARVQQHSGAPCHPILPGVDTAVFVPGPARQAEAKRIGYLYRSPALGYGFKGAACFWKAMQRVMQAAPGVEVRVLAPDGLPVDAPIPVEVVAANSDAEIAQFYRDIDLFVACSRSDGAQLGILEAMACGTPVVATDAGGLRDYATPGDNCFMGLPDDTAMLGDLVLAALHDPERARRFAANALSTARARTWEAFVAAAETALQTALAERGKEARP